MRLLKFGFADVVERKSVPSKHQAAEGSSGHRIRHASRDPKPYRTRYSAKKTLSFTIYSLSQGIPASKQEPRLSHVVDGFCSRLSGRDCLRILTAVQRLFHCTRPERLPHAASLSILALHANTLSPRLGCNPGALLSSSSDSAFVRQPVKIRDLLATLVEASRRPLEPSFHTSTLDVQLCLIKGWRSLRAPEALLCLQ